MSSRWKGLIAISIAALLWSSAPTVGKLLVAHANPFVIISYRFGLSSLIMLPFFLMAKKPKNYMHHLIPLGLLNAGNVLFYYWGIGHTMANTASIIATSVPLIVALLSPFLIHESVGKNKWIGIFFGILGVLFIILLPTLQKGETVSGTILGNILLFISALCWALYVIRSRTVLSKGTYSPFLATAVNFFVTTMCALAATVLTRQSLYVPALSSPNYLAVLLFSVIGITVLAFFLFQWGMQYISAATASLKDYIQLVIGVGINALILGERLTVGYFIGGTLVIVGVLIATKSKLAQRFGARLFEQGE